VTIRQREEGGGEATKYSSASEVGREEKKGKVEGKNSPTLEFPREKKKRKKEKGKKKPHPLKEGKER